jgi:outer membrane protein
MNVNLRSKGTWVALVLLCAGPVSSVWAQAGAAAPAKIAVMNVRNAIVATAEGKQAQAELQSKFASKQNDLQGMQKKIEDLQQKLNAGSRTLSADEQAKMQRDGEMLQHQLQRGTDDLNEQLQAAQGDIVDGIGRKMLEVLDRYSRENGYAVVLDTSAQGSPVVYGSAQSDITQEVVRLYDQAYPVKGGAPAASAPSAPAAPRPATPAPAPAKKATP